MFIGLTLEMQNAERKVQHVSNRHSEGREARGNLQSFSCCAVSMEEIATSLLLRAAPRNDMETWWRLRRFKQFDIKMRFTFEKSCAMMVKKPREGAL